MDKPIECIRCGSNIEKQFCIDITCPFSDYKQDNISGWSGHAYEDLYKLIYKEKK